jgi:hypothetical protein
MIKGKYILRNVLFHKFYFFIWNLCSKELILKNWKKLTFPSYVYDSTKDRRNEICNGWVKCLWELYLNIKYSEIINGNEYA